MAVAALLPAGVAAYAATTATASPSHVVARPAVAAAAFAPHAYPPPPPPTSAPPTTAPPTTAPPTTAPPTTAPPTTAPPTTAPPTTKPGHPTVVVGVGTGDGSTHQGGKIKVHVGKHAFTPGSVVTVVLHGPHGFTITVTRIAGLHGGLHTHVHIPADAPKGHYTLHVKGHHSGHKVKGTSGLHVSKG
ncbi:MAG TPA: hypothetical protein VG650_10130 [Mycobacteriales bacterium]|nr:hypothetical protein [Mycobacteriales bacterium]